MTTGGQQYFGGMGAAGYHVQNDDQVKARLIREEPENPYSDTKVGRLEATIAELQRQIKTLENRNRFLEELLESRRRAGVSDE